MVQLPETHWGDTADGGRPRLLLLHGITGGRLIWARLASAFADRGWHVTAVDLRGHGRAPRCDSYRVEEYAADLPVGPWDLVLGHSLGTVVAIYALQRSEFRCGRVILIEPVFYIPPSALSDVLNQQLTEVRDSVEAIRGRHPRWVEADVQAKAGDTSRLGDEGDETVKRTFSDNAPFDFRNMAKRINVPTLAVAADEAVGSTFETDAAKEMQEAVKGFDVVRMAGMGHSPHRDDLEATLKVMWSWLDRTSP